MMRKVQNLSGQNHERGHERDFVRFRAPSVAVAQALGSQSLGNCLWKVAPDSGKVAAVHSRADAQVVEAANMGLA